MIKAYLTIDDIASKNTPQIVDYLNGKGIKALMFAWGENVERYREEALYALKGGMLIGNHSYSHPHFSEISLEEGIAQIERCEEILDRLCADAGVVRKRRPFRFPYGDKGGKNKAAYQEYLAKHGYDKVKDTELYYPWWSRDGLDKDIDTFWTFDVEEYNIRPGSGVTIDDIFNKIHDPSPKEGAPLLEQGSRHIILLHAHDETEELVPRYYELILDHLLDKGVVFEEPEFI